MDLYQLYFYIPETHLEQAKEAIFAAGAGRVGKYSYCAWQVKGEGQFCPLSGSDPYLGQENSIEKVSEVKVEVICAEEHLNAVVAALKFAHPYETPAFGIIKLLNFGGDENANS